MDKDRAELNENEEEDIFKGEKKRRGVFMLIRV